MMEDKETLAEEKNEAEETITPEEVEAVAAEDAQSDDKETKAEKKKAKKTDSKIAELEKALAEKDALLAEQNDKYMRMMAEYDNFRKRSAKEKEGVYADAYSDCIANLLPILDNLERASGSDNLDAVKKGLEMTAKAFADALEKMGVSEVETLAFDPNFHNAVMHIEDDAYGESEIVEVFQKGYVKGDKVIRYAMVKVAN